MKREFSFLSRDEHTRIHGVMWLPEGKPKMILQICHGMVEFIERYEDFAEYLNGRGILVVGHDHLGHGASVTSEEEWGYFSGKNGNDYVIADIHSVRRNMFKMYPDVPYFILGHSMGSFLVRQYIEMYGEGLKGAVIMGTGNPSNAELAAGRLLCNNVALAKGWHYRSEVVNNIAFGSYNKGFEPARTSRDWLTKDTEIVDAYLADPRCMFTFTVNGYDQMFRGVQFAKDPLNIAKIPKNLPIFFVSGAEDPVGANGKGVREVYRSFREAGIRRLSIKLYETDRHEILNETDRLDVYADIAAWLEAV